MSSRITHRTTTKLEIDLTPTEVRELAEGERVMIEVRLPGNGKLILESEVRGAGLGFLKREADSYPTSVE